MPEPLETAELLAFTRTVDAKSLSRAAAELGVPRATIGRRLARLEQRLGVRLLRRTTRSLALTDAGVSFYTHARLVLDAVQRAEASVQQADQTVRGELRVSFPPISDPRFFDLICDFVERYPEVRLQAHFSTEYVDLSRAGYDAALRASLALEPGLVARTLAREPMIAVASPEYLAKHGAPRTKRDLRKHRCLMGFARGALPDTHWPVKTGGKIHVEGCFFTNELLLQRALALRGLGITMLPGFVLHDLIDTGQLVRVLPGELEAEARLALVYPEREFLPPPVRAFIDAFSTWTPPLIPFARDPRKALPPPAGAETDTPTTATPTPAKPSPAKPSPAKPSPAKPSPAKPSPAKPSPAKRRAAKTTPPPAQSRASSPARKELSGQR
jgi:DNA-binding transcriptional LysR family regulator